MEKRGVINEATPKVQPSSKQAADCGDDTTKQLSDTVQRQLKQQAEPDYR